MVWGIPPSLYHIKSGSNMVTDRLVGGRATPLKNMSSSVGMITPFPIQMEK